MSKSIGVYVLFYIQMVGVVYVNLYVSVNVHVYVRVCIYCVWTCIRVYVYVYTCGLMYMHAGVPVYLCVSI